MGTASVAFSVPTTVGAFALADVSSLGPSGRRVAVTGTVGDGFELYEAPDSTTTNRVLLLAWSLATTGAQPTFALQSAAPVLWIKRTAGVTAAVCEVEGETNAPPFTILAQGQVTLNGVTPVAVADIGCGAGSNIFLQPFLAETAGLLTIARTAGVGFTVASSAAIDARVVSYIRTS